HSSNAFLRFLPNRAFDERSRERAGLVRLTLLRPDFKQLHHQVIDLWPLWKLLLQRKEPFLRLVKKRRAACGAALHGLAFIGPPAFRRRRRAQSFLQLLPGKVGGSGQVRGCCCRLGRWRCFRRHTPRWDLANQNREDDPRQQAAKMVAVESSTLSNPCRVLTKLEPH